MNLYYVTSCRGSNPGDDILGGVHAKAESHLEAIGLAIEWFSNNGVDADACIICEFIADLDKVPSVKD